MNWLYALAQPFVWHPGRALVIALGCLALGFLVPRTARRPLVFVAVAWGAFAALEWEAWRERANIRVDLVVTWPLLCLLTVGLAGLALKRILVRKVEVSGETTEQAS